jgi:16S rRNA processing protein RimM
VLVPARRVLGKDEFWPDDLIGLAVQFDSGVKVGVVTDVITGGAQDRLVVSTDSGDREVPFVHDLVPAVDLTAGTVTVSSLPGLLDD